MYPIPPFSKLAQTPALSYIAGMSQTAAPIAPPKTEKTEKTEPRELRDRGYLVICWNDPVNLMVYVTHVFQIVFGWPKERAEQHIGVYCECFSYQPYLEDWYFLRDRLPSLPHILPII